MTLSTPFLSLALEPLLMETAVQETAEQPTGADPGVPPGPPPSFLSSPLFPLLLVGVMFFFLLHLPERKKRKQRQSMLDALKKGDRVMTSSGLYGTVVTTTSEIVVLQVADNVRLRFSRAAVQNVIEQEKEAALEEKAEPSKA
jgi:preprotein translocase subunit YajC